MYMTAKIRFNFFVPSLVIVVAAIRMTWWQFLLLFNFFLLSLSCSSFFSSLWIFYFIFHIFTVHLRSHCSARYYLQAWGTCYWNRCENDFLTAAVNNLSLFNFHSRFVDIFWNVFQTICFCCEHVRRFERQNFESFFLR